MGRPKNEIIDKKLDLAGVHKYSKLKSGTAWTLTGVHPVIRVKVKDYPVPVFIQHGVVFFENGEKVEEIPEIILKELEKLPEDTKKEVGL